jgi:hypothetical protein
MWGNGAEDEPKPFDVDHIHQPFKERLALRLDLLTQPIMRYQMNISQSILFRHRDITAVWNQVDRFGDAEFYKCD